MKEIDLMPDDFIDHFYEQVGKNVKRIREEHGLTQLKLAHAIGHKSVSIISRAEIFHKNQRFNLEHLAKIAFVLNVDICEFLKK
jgi:transcriptional regulator with XRE-family HTH domain